MTTNTTLYNIRITDADGDFDAIVGERSREAAETTLRWMRRTNQFQIGEQPYIVAVEYDRNGAPRVEARPVWNRTKEVAV